MMNYLFKIFALDGICLIILIIMIVLIIIK